MNDPRRAIPSVDALVEDGAFAPLLRAYPRRRIVEALRTVQASVRGEVGAGSGPADVTDAGVYARRVRAALEAADVPSLRGVINATGVVLHTNLGRAPLAAAARKAMADAAQGYTNLEFDLEEGARGSRYDHCVGLLKELTGAEDALVVNNCAGALMLTLNAVAQGRGVAVSRGELVEIGGGFRIPEVMERSGARLVEVGSTNRTRLEDYREATAGTDVAALLKVHRSNFRISGFTEEASLGELTALGGEVGIPVIYDLGSGLLVRAEVLGLPEEPTVREAVAAGVDVVAVSGDKLMGAPQAGVLLGRRDLIQALRRNPMTRALRVDKVTLAGLEATLRLYRDESGALKEIPTLRALATPEATLRGRAEALARRLTDAGVAGVAAVPSEGAVGGGTYPGVTLASWGIGLEHPDGAEVLARRLRHGTPGVVGRISDGRLRLDVRTVDPGEEDDLVRRIREAMEGREGEGRSAALRRAVFLDRDGTLIQEAHYLADPDGVHIVPGALAALRRLRDAGYALVLVTNQSGIAQGLYTEDDYRAVALRLDAYLAAAGIPMDATHYCPHHPDHTGGCACRKPGTGMYEDAAAELGLDLEASWYVGDKVTDVLPATSLGGRGILVRTGYGSEHEERLPEGAVAVDDVSAAAETILRS